MAGAGGFLQRWAQRKAQVRQGVVPAEPAPPLAAVVAEPLPAVAPAPQAVPAAEPAAEAPPPTLADVADLAPDAADFSRFVAPKVPAEVRNAAMKKLFADPHFNVMDGLDVYIDDYGQPDPLPAAWLQTMVQSKLLGLITDEPEARPAPGPPPPLLPEPDNSA